MRRTHKQNRSAQTDNAGETAAIRNADTQGCHQATYLVRLCQPCHPVSPLSDPPRQSPAASAALTVTFALNHVISCALPRTSTTMSSPGLTSPHRSRTLSFNIRFALFLSTAFPDLPGTHTANLDSLRPLGVTNRTTSRRTTRRAVPNMRRKSLLALSLWGAFTGNHQLSPSPQRVASAHEPASGSTPSGHPCCSSDAKTRGRGRVSSALADTSSSPCPTSNETARRPAHIAQTHTLIVSDSLPSCQGGACSASSAPALPHPCCQRSAGSQRTENLSTCVPAQSPLSVPSWWLRTSA